MNKKLRLIALISSSYLLSEGDKHNLLNSLKGMSEETVNTLGFVLATEKKQSLETNGKLNEIINKVLSSLSL